MEAGDRASDGSEAVTILMASYNGERHLQAQLDSFAAQTHRNWRLFVSDDGSTDKTLGILQDFARDYPVQIVNGPQQGAGMNFLSALCHPDLPRGILALADQDDVWLKGKLARGLRRIAAAPDPAAPLLYSTESLIADGELNLLKRSTPGNVAPGFAPALAQNLFAGHSMMLNAPALALARSAGCPEGVIWHDWWLYQLLAGSGAQLVLDPLPTVIYRQHGSNTLGVVSGPGAALRRLRMVLDGEWGETIRAHTAALGTRRSFLTPAARELLDAYQAIPPRGLSRARRLLSLGIRRSSRAGDMMMALAAVFGRI